MSKRILLTSLVITLFILLFFAFTSNEVYYAQLEGGLNSDLVRQINYLDQFEPDESVTAEYIANALKGVDVTIYDQNGNIVDSTFPDIIGSTDESSEIKSALLTADNYIYNTPSDNDGRTYLHICKRYGNILIRLTGELVSRGRMFLTVMPTLVVFILIDILLCLLFTWMSTYFVLKPVKELAINAIGNNKQVETKYSELKPIADVINWKNEYVRTAQQSKDEFISNVTHEMNTPLTSIRGFAELISSGSMPGDKMIAAGKTIKTQSDRLSAMIKQILNYSAIDDDTVTPYDVNVSKLTEEALDNFTPMLKDKNLTILKHIEDNVIIKSTHERITEIIDNLVSNAIKYNKQNGKIIVTLRGNVLTVEDTGIGINNDEINHIFSRFYTVDKSHGESVGFGLGLPIVRKICDRSGWTINVDSVPGEGTTFKIVFETNKKTSLK